MPWLLLSDVDVYTNSYTNKRHVGDSLRLDSWLATVSTRPSKRLHSVSLTASSVHGSCGLGGG